ncbi:hypothetical protein [Roseivivax jejudonensis]|uniref:hypothetical protein n=1 Tax=Roseivivax jejudonensis TaxID=1529041 RepID=UPI00117B735F|nr:hypothetical protein [Roseivivax jejudonensis]
MARLIMSLLLAAVLTGIAAASALHASEHWAPTAAHHPIATASHTDAIEALSDLAECCDVLGGASGGTCLLDATFSAAVLVASSGSLAGRSIHCAPLVLRGRDTAPPTGPPKV